MNTDAKVTIRDVARLSGVSIMTVSRAFHGSGRISPATRRRVLSAAEELNYRPNFSAQVLRGGKTRTVGIVVSNPLASSMARRLSELLMVDGYVTFPADSLGDEKIMTGILDNFTSRKVDAILLGWGYGPDRTPEFTDSLRGLKNLLIFSVDGQRPGFPVDCCTSNMGIAYQSVIEHWLKSGRERIYVLGRRLYPSSRQGLAELARAGINPGGRLIETADYPSAPGFTNHADALMDALRRGEQIQAVITSCDQAAAQVCRRLREHGLRVPEDIAVIGNGNNDMDEFCMPPLASIDPRSFEVAQTIYELLMNRLNHPDSEFQEKTINAEFIHRDSAG